jgi:hypothetical protein
MTHEEIINQEIVEQYVLNRLSSADRQAFQEHFFECDDCFAQAQTTARFVSGVRQASATGAFAPVETQKGAAAGFWSSGWWRPALAISFAACLLLVVAVIWLSISRIQLQREITNERQARQTSETGVQQSLESARRDADEKQRQLDAERAERAKLEQRLDELEHKSGERPDQNLLAQNVPSVTLESSRDTSAAAQLTIPPGANRVRFLIPTESTNRFRSFSVEILTKSKTPVDTINGARPSRSGSLSVSVAAAHLNSGDYRVRLYGVNQTQRELLAEFDLRVVKQ